VGQLKSLEDRNPWEGLNVQYIYSKAWEQVQRKPNRKAGVLQQTERRLWLHRHTVRQELGSQLSVSISGGSLVSKLLREDPCFQRTRRPQGELLLISCWLSGSCGFFGSGQKATSSYIIYFISSSVYHFSFPYVFVLCHSFLLSYILVDLLPTFTHFLLSFLFSILSFILDCFLILFLVLSFLFSYSLISFYHILFWLFHPFHLPILTSLFTSLFALSLLSFFITSFHVFVSLFLSSLLLFPPISFVSSFVYPSFLLYFSSFNLLVYFLPSSLLSTLVVSSCPSSRLTSSPYFPFVFLNSPFLMSPLCAVTGNLLRGAQS
jgi:hypothetical protein